jgi:hypothetical protein
MARYHCKKCNERFVKEELNMNQRHGCGEFAYVIWNEDEDDADQTGEE